MLFLEDHIQAVLPWLQAGATSCDAMVSCISATEVVKLTQDGPLRHAGEAERPDGALKR
jgi:magnesium chelatase subunit H